MARIYCMNVSTLSICSRACSRLHRLGRSLRLHLPLQARRGHAAPCRQVPQRPHPHHQHQHHNHHHHQNLHNHNHHYLYRGTRCLTEPVRNLFIIDISGGLGATHLNGKN